MSHAKASRRLARLAGRTLRNPKATKAQKSLAGSVLANAPHKRGRAKGRRR
jgi:hypothetical protein